VLLRGQDAVCDDAEFVHDDGCGDVFVRDDDERHGDDAVQHGYGDVQVRDDQGWDDDDVHEWG
jgi:hypothetical protein